MTKGAFPLPWRKSIKGMKSALLRTGNREIVSVEGFVSLIGRMGDPRVDVSFGVVENLTADVQLGTSFIDCLIRLIFPSERKAVLSNSRTVMIVFTQKRVNALTTDTEEVDLQTVADSNTLTQEHFLCRVACQVTIPPYSQAAVMVSGCGARLMTIETHQNAVEHKCSMSVVGLMDTRPYKPL